MMITTRYPILLLVSLFYFKAQSQDTLKSFTASRINGSVKVDGILDESFWSGAQEAHDLIQNIPNEGKEPTQKTEFRIVYDNNAVYIGAMLYDTAPDSILHELGRRDDGDLNSDGFRFVVDPYNTRQDAYDFGVWASGVQTDSKFSDQTYDAIWESATKITDKGWCVEIKIPYSAIRFPKKEIQEWGLQVTRSIRRNREFDQWSLTPKDVPNAINYWGNLYGIKNIKSPIRLSVTPFITAYFERAPLTLSTGRTKESNAVSFTAGADLKYGIDDRFTIDMTLLPDFGQVQSDNKVKNLSYRETTYDENRPFFKEGTDLFNKDALFYSRRIGKIPTGYYNLEGELKEGESIKKNPSQVRLLNAVKLSGRTNNGLGIGIFNAVTNNTYGTLEDAEGNTREVLTEPLTNYNIFVFDQQLKNNSNIYFLNTNVVRDKHGDDANVTDLGFTFFNKKNSWATDCNFALSQLYHRIDSLPETHQNALGYKYFLGIRKTSGNFQYGVSRQVLNNTFSSSDMGYQAINNLANNRIYLDYNTFNPGRIFRESSNTISMDYQTNFLTGKRTEFSIDVSMFGMLLNYLAIFGGGGATPMVSYDYNEPREGGDRFQKTLRYYYFYAGFSTDYRKKLALDVTQNYSNFIDRFVLEGYNTDITLRYRMNDHLSIKYNFTYNFDPFNVGHVDIDTAGTNIYGGRELNTIINGITLQYIFNKNMSLNLSGRHYWARASYRKYLTLTENGDLSENHTYHVNNDFNYNALNIDLQFTWRFAPGSDMSVVYKNAIENEDAEHISNFGKNFSNTLNYPQSNSISFKILYYLDYLYLRKKS